MLRTFRGLILLALVALVWNVTPAYSTTLTTYNNLAAWQAATSGDSTITFTGLAPGTMTAYSSGVSYPDVQFIGISNGIPPLEVMDTSAFSWANFGSGEALMQSMNRGTTDPVPYIHVVFNTPVTAFGSDLFTTSSYGMSFAITVLGTQFVAPTFSQPTRAFWGVTSDTPITSADFTVQGTAAQGNTIAFLDNFQYGTTQAAAPPDVPEAATLLMIGSGLIGLACLRKRIKPGSEA